MRPLVLDDVPALCALDRACFGEGAWSAAQIEGSLVLPTTRAIGCEEDGVLVGFYLAQTVCAETEILTLGVHPDRQRKGLGRALLDHLIATTKEGIVFLDVAVDNGPARALYEQTGFRPFGVRKGYYRRRGGLVDAVNYRYIIGG